LLSSEETNLYPHIKSYCTKHLKINTQFIQLSTLEVKGLPAAAKISLQMTVKSGNKLWIVPKNHPYWQDKKVALASISYSKNCKNSFSVALVGTTDNEQSSVYSYSMMNLSMKDQISAQIYRNFFMQWLKNYAEREKALPDSIIIYREGLSDVQIKKTITDELENLYLTLNTIKSNSEKYKNYNPEIVLFIVNKKVNSKFFDYDQKNTNNFGNPTSGSVIFCEMTSNNQVDFYLIPQKVE
jgi:hypothetical protein